MTLPLGRNNYGGKLTKGTTGERNAISSPSLGDLHYNTTTNQMNIYADGIWKELALTIPTNQVALLSGSAPPQGPSFFTSLLAGAGGLTGTGTTQGTATESDYQPNNYISFQATAAFNGTLSNTSDYWGSNDTGIISSSNPKWIRFEFPNDVAVGKYKIWPRAENGQHNPKEWKLYAYQHQSNTAVVIDSRTEENWYNTSTSSVINDTDYNEYTTNDNTTMYRKFELNITDTHDSNNKYAKIGELAFYGPGSDNNNNIFYKNTNPYNLKVYRNAWKTLPLQLTNEPSFSYGTTIPSESSGNRGDIFYNTTNNSLNLRRNHPASTDDQWFSIIDGPLAPPPPLGDVSLGDGIFTQSVTNNLYKIDGNKFYVAIHKNNISTTEKLLDIDYINTSYSATGVKVYTFTGGSDGGDAVGPGDKLYDYKNANGGGGHTMAVYSGAAGGSGTISRYMRIETTNVANTSLQYKGSQTQKQIEIKLINNQGLSASKRDIKWESTTTPTTTVAGVTAGTYYPCSAAANGGNAKTFTMTLLEKSASRYQHTLQYTGSGNKFNNGTAKLLLWPPALPGGNGAGGDSSVPYGESWDPPGYSPNPPTETSYRSAQTVSGGTNGSYTNFDNFLSTSGGENRSSVSRGQNIQFAFETAYPEYSYGDFNIISGQNGPGGKMVYRDDGNGAWSSVGRLDVMNKERTSSAGPTVSDSYFGTNYYDDTGFMNCIDSLNTTFGIKSDFYNQISGGKGGWVEAGAWTDGNVWRGPVQTFLRPPVTKGMPDYPIFLVYEGLQEN